MDRLALEALWLAERRWVASVLLAHMPAGADLEDLLQDVALRLVQNIGEIEDLGRLRGWLRQVAVHRARDEARRVRRVRDRMQSDAPAPELLPAPDEAPALEARRAVDRILECAAALPSHYREPLFLRCFEGLSQREIAELLEVPETTVETRLSRARKRLRETADLPLPSGPRPGDKAP